VNRSPSFLTSSLPASRLIAFLTGKELPVRVGGWVGHTANMDMVNKARGCGMDSSGSGQQPLASSREHNSKPSVSNQGWEFLAAERLGLCRLSVRKANCKPLAAMYMEVTS